MALSSIRVLIDEGRAQYFPLGIGERAGEKNNVSASEAEGCVEFTKAEAEAIAGSARVGKIIHVSPEIREAKIIKLRTEATDAEAAHFVRACMGGGAGINGNLICVKGTEWKEEEP